MQLIRKNVERIAESEAQIAKLKAMGFKEMPNQEKIAVPKSADQQLLLDKMDLTELKALAKEKGISGYSSLKKEELLLVLKDVI